MASSAILRKNKRILNNFLIVLVKTIKDVISMKRFLTVLLIIVNIFTANAFAQSFKSIDFDYGYTYLSIGENEVIKTIDIDSLTPKAYFCPQETSSFAYGISYNETTFIKSNVFLQIGLGLGLSYRDTHVYDDNIDGLEIGREENYGFYINCVSIGFGIQKGPYSIAVTASPAIIDTSYEYCSRYKEEEHIIPSPAYEINITFSYSDISFYVGYKDFYKTVWEPTEYVKKYAPYKGAFTTGIKVKLLKM